MTTVASAIATEPTEMDEPASIEVMPSGVRLDARHQKLEGLVTPTGLAIRSTTSETPLDAPWLRVMAERLSRTPTSEREFDPTGVVQYREGEVRFQRPGIVEEYFVSMNGIRQDFVIAERLKGTGALVLELAVDGATARSERGMVTLTLAGSGREIGYDQLRVTDARGTRLPASFDVMSSDAVTIRVDDSGALYPIRVDPTLSDVEWISTGGYPGANDYIEDMAIDESGNIYVVGEFTAIGNTAANCVAMWDGDEWSPLGAGLQADFGAYCYAVAVNDGDVYVGGYFTTAGGVPAENIARWDGSNWSALGDGLDSGVLALTFYESELYAGGWFHESGDTELNRIAKWDGNTWSPLGSGTDNDTTDNYVNTILVANGELYVGGSFTSAGEVVTTSIAKWDGSTWSGLGEGLGNANNEPSVRSIAALGTDIYVAGRFSPKPEAEVQNFARWDGSSWSSIPGFSGTASSLAVLGGVLHVSGNFSTTAGSSSPNLATWNGSTWSELEVDLSAEIYPIRAIDGNLYAGRQIEEDFNEFFVASQLQGTSWSSLGGVPGFVGEITAIAVSDTDIYVGGFLASTPDGPANGIAMWDGSNWSALGDGVDGSVAAIAVNGNDVYVGGNFDAAGGVPANNVAKWDGNTWSALGAGTDSRVSALTTDGVHLYVGGSFQNAGSVTANGVARWDGSNWSALGSGVGSSGPNPFFRVFALAMEGDNLLAGGSFTTAGGTVVNGIARWDGISWSALGTGVNDVVSAILVDGTDVYVGGWFSEAGGIPASGIAKWNGSSWSALGSGLVRYGRDPGEESVGEAQALLMLGGELLVAGFIDQAGAVEVNSLAVWDGNAWSGVGSGTDGAAQSLAAFDDGFYVGGFFNTAGEILSPALAFARPGNGSGGNEGPFVEFSLVGEVTVYLIVPEAGDYEILRSTDVDAPENEWESVGNVPGAAAGVVNFVDEAPPTEEAFYRARKL